MRGTLTGGHPERQVEHVRRGPVKLIIHGHSDYKPPASVQAFNASANPSPTTASSCLPRVREMPGLQAEAEISCVEI